jgi:hypothetical protein
VKNNQDPSVSARFLLHFLPRKKILLYEQSTLPVTCVRPPRQYKVSHQLDDLAFWTEPVFVHTVEGMLWSYTGYTFCATWIPSFFVLLLFTKITQKSDVTQLFTAHVMYMLDGLGYLHARKSNKKKVVSYIIITYWNVLRFPMLVLYNAHCSEHIALLETKLTGKFVKKIYHLHW